MSKPLILLVGVIYLIVGIDQLLKGGIGQFITWVAYAAANVGLAMTAK